LLIAGRPWSVSIPDLWIIERNSSHPRKSWDSRDGRNQRREALRNTNMVGFLVPGVKDLLGPESTVCFPRGTRVWSRRISGRNHCRCWTWNVGPSPILQKMYVIAKVRAVFWLSCSPSTRVSPLPTPSCPRLYPELILDWKNVKPYFIHPIVESFIVERVGYPLISHDQRASSLVLNRDQEMLFGAGFKSSQHFDRLNT